MPPQPIYFPPVSGTDGRLFIGSQTLPMTRWTYQMSTVNCESWTAASGLFPDAMTDGPKRLIIAAEGIVRRTFNPYNPVLNYLLGSTQEISCQLQDAPDFTYATAYTAKILEWSWATDNAGQPTWRLKAVGSFRFSDFFNDEA